MLEKAPVSAAPKRSIDWVNSAFMTLTPVLALAGTVVYVARHGLHWMDPLVFLFMYVTTGLSVTAGYHRHYSHRAYDCSRAVQLFYLLFGAAAIENSVLRWSRDHRLHHQKVDTPEDPYNILQGFFYAHMGWIYYKTPKDRDFATVPDLLRDPLVRWQDRYYLPLLVLVSFGLPSLIGWTVGRPGAGFLFGGLLRVVVVQHMTFCINSLAHYVGTRPYDLEQTARDSWWLAFITYGEGYHNFHHKFAADYRNGHKWYQFDPTKWWINILYLLGQARRLTRMRDELILRARIETDVQRIQERLAHAPEELTVRFERRMQAAREQLETAYARWEDAKKRYRELKDSLSERARESRELWALRAQEWKLRSREYGFEFQAAQARWALLIAACSRFRGLGPLS